MSTADDIRVMLAAFGQHTHRHLHKPEGPIRGLRLALLSEKFREYMLAEQSQDIVSVAESLAELVTVAYGTGYAYGFDLDTCIGEVVRANMSKLDDGPITRDETGDVIPGAGYEPPRIADLIGHMDGGPWSDEPATGTGADAR